MRQHEQACQRTLWCNVVDEEVAFTVHVGAQLQGAVLRWVQNAATYTMRAFPLPVREGRARMGFPPWLSAAARMKSTWPPTPL